MNDLSEVRLRRHLSGWVPEVRYLPETDSTNLQALAWARQGAPHGSVVVADHQSAGRGRLDRRWLAPPGSSLLFSVVLRPELKPELRGLLCLAAGVAGCEFLSSLEIKAGLKWPNDILLGDRKVAGILAEASGEVVVLGAGLNVHQTGFPPEIAESATSLAAHTARSFDRTEVLAGWISHLAPLVDGPPAVIRSEYGRWCSTLGRRVRVDLGEGGVEDEAVDIDGTGALVLAGGRTVSAGDVVQLR